ncbi:MAG: PAS domain S-box protein [Dehalococcoidia bacterium]|nr:PAS domain S-box protein [Dehalococcoidia bacterium]
MTHDIATGGDPARGYEPGSSADPVAEVRALKRWVQAGVYGTIIAFIPFDAFLIQQSLLELLVNNLLYVAVATAAIEGAFSQMFKLRRRSAYPNALVMALGSVQTVEGAAGRALQVVQGLLGLDASFLALGSAADLHPLAVSGVSRTAAKAILKAAGASVAESMRSGEPLPLGPAPLPAKEGKPSRWVCLPIVSLHSPIGILAFPTHHPSGQLKDRELLRGIGRALGLSLKNLRQREELRKSEAHLRVMVEQMPAVLWTTDTELRFTSSLGAGLAGLGLRPNQVLEMTLHEYFSADDDEFPAIAAHRRALTGETATYEFEWTERAFHTHIEPLRDAEGRVVGTIGVALDVTEGKRTDALLAGEKRVLEMVARGAPLQEVLEVLTRNVEEQANGMLCSILLLDQGGTNLRHGAAPSLPDAYNQAVDGIAIGPKVGSCGTAAYLKRPVIVSDIAIDPLWADVRHLALSHGLRACWSTPILASNGAVLGTAALYYREPREPNAQDLELIERVTHIAGIAIDRRLADEALRRRERELKALVENAPDIIARFDSELRHVYVNPAVERVMGMPPEEIIGKTHSELGMPEELYSTWQTSLRAVFDTGEERVIEFGTPKGARYYQSRLVPEFADDGSLETVLTITRDITEHKRAEEALRASETNFRDLVENISEVIYAQDKDGRVTYVSPVVEQIGGYSPQEVIGRPFTDFIHPDDLPSLMESFRRTVAGNPEPFEYRVATKTGDFRWVRTSSRPVYEGDRIVGLRAVLMDITDRRRVEEALRESETKFRTLAETVAAAAFIFQGNRMCYVNSAAEAQTGYSREELLTMDFWEVIHPDFRPLVKKRGLARQRGEQVPARYEVKLLTRNGEERWVDFMAAAIEFEGKPAVLGTAFDITERKAAEETIRHLAYHDGLTGLPNRTLFEDRLTVTLAQGRRKRRLAAIMFLDLDRFKVVNDTVGHAMGDRLLQSVAERLKGLVREGDTVARVGGDEFTVLLPDVGRVEDAVEVADRILETLRQPWRLNDHEFHITTSIGIAMCPGDGEDAESLLRNADTAMYRAKDRGRDNYKLYAPAMNSRIAERLALENSLRHALERGEFVVHYQPQVNIETGRIVGVEALVRWQHPERGLVSPLEFIPVAEETGLIVPLGAWVLRTACAQNRAWQDAGLPPMRMAVNLSARQFQRRDLLDTVASALAETGLPPQYLQLEITEGAAMQDVDLTLAILRELREAGVQISIDDFGTGHSSLSYLKRFPIDVIKIDQSFVQDLTIDPNNAAIASTIIVMAHALNLTVIAEGVETAEQLAFLRERECDEMQGFLFSRPAPAPELDQMLRRNGRRSRSSLPAELKRR